MSRTMRSSLGIRCMGGSPGFHLLSSGATCRVWLRNGTNSLASSSLAVAAMRISTTTSDDSLLGTQDKKSKRAGRQATTSTGAAPSRAATLNAAAATDRRRRQFKAKFGALKHSQKPAQPDRQKQRQQLLMHASRQVIVCHEISIRFKPEIKLFGGDASIFLVQSAAGFTFRGTDGYKLRNYVCSKLTIGAPREHRESIRGIR